MAALRAPGAGLPLPSACQLSVIAALYSAITALRAAGTSLGIDAHIAVISDYIAVIGDCRAVIGGHITVPFQKMPVFSLGMPAAPCFCRPSCIPSGDTLRRRAGTVNRKRMPNAAVS